MLDKLIVYLIFAHHAAVQIETYGIPGAALVLKSLINQISFNPN